MARLMRMAAKVQTKEIRVTETAPTTISWGAAPQEEAAVAAPANRYAPHSRWA